MEPLHELVLIDTDHDVAGAISREGGKLPAFIKARVRNDADAEDILQDVFFEFIQAYQLPESIERVGGWLFRVARNRIIDRFRKKKEISFSASEEQDGGARYAAFEHLAFSHDFSQFEKNAADERKAIAALGEVLLGSDRPFVVTSGTALAANVDGKPSTEDGPTSSWNPRAGLESIVKELTERGVKTSIVRLAQIHDTHKQGLVPYFTAVAREKRMSAYLGEGNNRWPAAHVSDTARLYRLAFEKAAQGAIYHAVGEEGISMKTIAEALGRGLKVPVVSIKPEESSAHFGWLSMFAGQDMPSSSAITRETLKWQPTGPGLITDLDGMDYEQV